MANQAEIERQAAELAEAVEKLGAGPLALTVPGFQDVRRIVAMQARLNLSMALRLHDLEAAMHGVRGLCFVARELEKQRDGCAVAHGTGVKNGR